VRLQVGEHGSGLVRDDSPHQGLLVAEVVVQLRGVTPGGRWACFQVVPITLPSNIGVAAAATVWSGVD
jgi:hypothetical protein